MINNKDQEEAIKKYLRHCFREKVLPFPLLGTKEKPTTLRDLIFEDTSIDSK